MRLLLDTHVVLWLLAEPARVPDAIRSDLATRRNELMVSAVSGLEIATKSRLGKLDAAHLGSTLPRRLGELSATELPVSLAHGLLAGSLDWPHRDPFDRLLVAQALHERATLVTVDRAVVDAPGLRTLTWR